MHTKRVDAIKNCSSTTHTIYIKVLCGSNIEHAKMNRMKNLATMQGRKWN